MSNKKTSKNIVLTIMGVLILAMLISYLYLTFTGINTATGYVLAACTIVSLIFIALYGFFLYKKPHGNMLKYAMLILAASQMLRYSNYLSAGVIAEYLNILVLLSSGVLIFVAGRLNRIEQNRYLLIVALLARLIAGIIGIAHDGGVAPVLFLITYLFDAVEILTLCCAYFVRYKEHKEAGLADK